MHNHVANCGRKALLKQIFSVFLIFTLYFNSFNSANASTSLGGWTITSQIAQGASTAITATKTSIINGASVLKTSTAKITPNASQVAKVLRGGAVGYALSVAVEQILGAGIDWVLDPDNNRVIYYEEKTLNLPYLWVWDSRLQGYQGVATAEDACKKHEFTKQQSQQSGGFYYTKNWRVKVLNTDDATCEGETYYNSDDRFGGLTTAGVNRKQNSLYNPTAEDTREKKYLGLDTVAAQVISNAESHADQQKKAGAQTATTAAAQDMLANDAAAQSDAETQLNTNAKTQTSEQATGETKPNELNPEITDISLSFPAFCGWAPSVCEAANVVINFPNTLTNWWTTATTSISDAWIWTKSRYEASVTSISDFFKNEPDQTDNTDLPVQEIPTPQLETNAFTATAGCPEPIPIQIKIGVEGTAHISYEPICQFASKWSFIAPLIGFLSGAMIIVGVGRKGEDSEI